MTGKNAGQRMFGPYARILSYPRTDLTETVRECAALVSPGNPEAAALMHEFRTFVEETSLERLQEVYTVTFDLDATRHPYVGYHLFGETYKRSAFLVGLKEQYKTYGFRANGNELPDHLAEILGFLAICDDEEMRDEMIRLAVLPTLEKMFKQTEEAKDLGDGNGMPETHDREKQDRRTRSYEKVLKALQLTLQQQYPVGEEVSHV